MSFFRGTQYVPGIGWIQDSSAVGAPVGTLPTPSPYDAGPQSALSGEADVMMISGLGETGPSPGIVPPSGGAQPVPDWTKGLWLVAVGIVIGIVIHTMIQGEKSRGQSS